MKVLVMGAGRMGAIRVEDLAADPRVTEVMITNRNQPKAQALAVQFGATVVPWDNATDRIADAVVVAVGTDGHEFVLNGVLPHALPVLCEKPIALTVEATQAVIDLAKRSGSGLQIGFQRRFDSAIREVHDTIESGAVGTLYALTMTAHDFTPSTKEFMGGSGGIFRDLHVHDFDLIRWLTGSEVAKVYATKAVREFTDYAEFDDADVLTIKQLVEANEQYRNRYLYGANVRADVIFYYDQGIEKAGEIRKEIPFSYNPIKRIIDDYEVSQL